VFWGRGWSDVGPLFLRWNGLGLALFVLSILLVVRWATKRPNARPCARWTLLTSPLLYVLCLLPYLFTGALASGHPGGYTFGACSGNLRMLRDALLAHTQAHEGRLPSGRSMSEILPALQPYLMNKRSIRHLEFCPVGGPYESQPKPYLWNARVAGESLSELAELAVPEVLLACPYGHASGPEPSSVSTSELLDLCEALVEVGLDPRAPRHLDCPVRAVHRGAGVPQ
jgi:hypothetical protein